MYVLSIELSVTVTALPSALLDCFIILACSHIGGLLRIYHPCTYRYGIYFQLILADMLILHVSNFLWLVLSSSAFTDSDIVVTGQMMPLTNTFSYMNGCT